MRRPCDQSEEIKGRGGGERAHSLNQTKEIPRNSRGKMYPTDLGQQGSLAAGLSSLCLWWEGQGWLARLGRESFRGQGQLSPGPQSQHCVCDRKWTQAAVGSGGRPCRGCPGRAAALPHLGAALLCMSLGTAIRPTPVSSCVQIEML